jgi:NAD-dependent DNA ligase
VLHARLQATLADSRISEEEREHLASTLRQIAGGTLDRLAERGAVNQLAFDEAAELEFEGSTFCLTGDFVFGPRPRCIAEISARGGSVINGVTKRLDYLIVGTLGSEEWKHGSYGTKIEKAIEYKRAGVPLSIVREDCWAEALRS